MQLKQNSLPLSITFGFCGDGLRHRPDLAPPRQGTSDLSGRKSSLPSSPQDRELLLCHTFLTFPPFPFPHYLHVPFLDSPPRLPPIAGPARRSCSVRVLLRDLNHSQTTPPLRKATPPPRFASPHRPSSPTTPLPPATLETRRPSASLAPFPHIYSRSSPYLRNVVPSFPPSFFPLRPLPSPPTVFEPPHTDDDDERWQTLSVR